MNNDKNELYMMVINLANKIKSTCNCYVNTNDNQDDNKIFNKNLKSFTENKRRLENYQEASKYTEEDVTNRN